MSPRLTAFLLLTQAFAAAARGDLVLCLHGDGHVAVETSARLCCREDTACREGCGEDGCAAEEEGRAVTPAECAGAGAGGCCRDFTLVKCGPISLESRSVRGNDPTGGADLSPLVGPMGLCEGTELFARRLIALQFAPDGRSGTLARLKTTFLRL